MNILREGRLENCFGEPFSDGGAVGGAGLSMDAAAYYSTLNSRIFEFFRIPAVETSIQGTAVSVRYVHHGDWLGEHAQPSFA